MPKPTDEEKKVKKERKPIIRNKNAYYVLYFVEDNAHIKEMARFSTPEQLYNEYQKEIEENPDKEFRERLVLKKEVTLEPKIIERKMRVRL